MMWLASYMYLAAELLNTADDLRHVTTVEQVDRLEQARPRDAVRLTEVDERFYVLHLHPSPSPPPAASSSSPPPPSSPSAAASVIVG